MTAIPSLTTRGTTRRARATTRARVLLVRARRTTMRRRARAATRVVGREVLPTTLARKVKAKARARVHLSQTCHGPTPSHRSRRASSTVLTAPLRTGSNTTTSLRRRTAVSSSPTHRAYRIGSALASTPRVLAPRCSRTLKSSSCASTRMGYVAAGSAQLPWKCHWPRTRRPHQYNVEYSWSSWARRTSPTSPTMHESRVLFKPSRQRPSVFTRT